MLARSNRPTATTSWQLPPDSHHPNSMYYATSTQPLMVGCGVNGIPKLAIAPSMSDYARKGKHSPLRRLSPRSAYIKTRRLVSVHKDPREFYDFTVMTYNVLSQSYWKPEYNFSCPATARAEKYRRLNVMGEILSKKPDILCLQELDEPAHRFFEDRLREEGYVGVYQKRPGWHSDGLATFVNSKAGLRIATTRCLDLNTAIDLGAKVVTTLHPDRFTRNNIALLALLEVPVLGDAKRTTRRIVLCNSHIYWNPSCVDVKLLQAEAVLRGISEFIADALLCEGGVAERTPVVFAADMNSLPGSSVFDLVEQGPRGKVASADLAKYGINPGEDLLTLKSAYSHLSHPDTNFTKTFRGCIDYIWYSDDSLEVTHLLEAFDHKQASFIKHGSALPNPHCSSDHISLMSGFRFTDEEDQPYDDAHDSPVGSTSMSASTLPFFPKRASPSAVFLAARPTVGTPPFFLHARGAAPFGYHGRPMR